MAKITVKAELRPKKSTRKSLSDTREAKKIPGVVYGGKNDNLHVVVVEKELLDALKEGGSNAIIHLAHEKGEDTVILREFQRHVVTGRPLHVDFQRISLKEKIEVKVPIQLVGESVGVKTHGGTLEHILREIEVRGLPGDIPQNIELDVTELDVGQGVLVKDLNIPAGLKVLADAESIVANVLHAMKEEEPEPVEAAAEGAEPEVIAKGKKEEEEGAEKKGEGAEKKGEKKAEKKEEPKKGSK